MKIRWILVFFVMFFASYVCAVEDDVITKVEVKGSFHNVKPGKILRTIKLKKGKPYSIDAARKDAGAIMSLDCVENVEFSYDKGKRVLTFTVVEKRYIIDTITFKGNSKGFTAKKLKKISLLKEKKYYDSSKFDKTKEEILKLYKDNGYSNCHIQGYPTDNLDANRVTVTFLITEDHQTLVGGIDIKGVTSFEKKKILGLIKKIKEKKAYSEKFLEEAKPEIERFYKKEGFMDYKLVSSSAIYNEKKTEVFLTLNISEGSKYKIDKITHNGNLSVDDKEIKKLIKLKKNQVFNDNEIYKTEDNIRDFYANRGYLSACIDHNCFNKDATNGTTDINFSIQENYPFYVGSINIYGLEGTKRSFIERELLLKQGDLLKRDKLLRSIQKLQDLSFIKNVEYKQTPAAGMSDTLDLTLDIVESLGLNANITGGIVGKGCDGVFGELKFGYENLFGRGQTVAAHINLDKKGETYALTWSEPWILNKNASLHMKGFYSDRKEDLVNKTDAYKVKTFGGTCEVGHRVDEDMSFSGGYKFEHARFFDIKEEAKNMINSYYGLSKPKDKTKISSILGSWTYDSLDYHLNPSTGSRSYLGAQLASSLLVGDVNFLKFGGETTWHFPTFWKSVLSINMEGCMIMPYGKQEQVPISERFSSAGFVRGYDEKDGIGPEFNGTIKGLMNIEYKFPIFDKGGTIIQGIVFSDIGGIWNDWKDISLKMGSKNNNLHSSLGFGVRFITPLGPLRFDTAWGFNHHYSKKRGWVFGFSVK